MKRFVGPILQRKHILNTKTDQINHLGRIPNDGDCPIDINCELGAAKGFVNDNQPFLYKTLNFMGH